MRSGRGQLVAASRMVDAGYATRPTDGFRFDPSQGKEVQAVEAVIASAEAPLRCRIRAQNSGRVDSEVGARTSVALALTLHLPATRESAVLQPGDLWTIATSASDSITAEGRVYRITGAFDGTFVTACRYPVEVVT